MASHRCPVIEKLVTYLDHLRVEDGGDRIDNGIDAGLADGGGDVEGAHRATLT